MFRELHGAVAGSSVTHAVPAVGVVWRLLPPVFTGAIAASTSLAVAWALTHGMAPVSVLLAVLVPLALMLLAWPVFGVQLAIVVAVIVPSAWYFALPQAAAPRLAAIAALGAVVLAAVSGRRRALSRHPLDLAACAFVLAALTSWALDNPVPDSLQHATNYVTPVVFYLAARWFAAEHLDAILWTLLACGTFGALTLYVEYFVTQEPLFVDKTSYYWTATDEFIFRPGGVFGSPPAAGTVLAMTSLAALPLLGRQVGGRRAVVWAAFLISVGALFLTFTRGPMIAFTVGTLLYLALARPKWWGRFAYGAAMVVAGTVLIVLPRLAGETWYEEGVLRQGTFQARQSFWAQSWPVVENSYRHLAIGHGVNSLVVGRPTFPGPVDADIASMPLLTEHGPHNQYVRTAVEQGLVGLLILVLWLGGTVWVGVRTARRLTEARAVVAALTAATASLLVVNLVNDALRHPPTLAVAALLSGLVATLAVVSRETAP